MKMKHTLMDKRANRLAVRHYFGEIRKGWVYTLPALALPGIGTIFTTYLPPLVVARLIQQFSERAVSLHGLLPYILLVAGFWLTGELLWRIAFLCLNRSDAQGMGNLYNTALSELAKKDIGFFHDNFAGSLTKKALGYGRAYESFVDTLAFNVLSNVIPIAFAVVILWRFSPWLVVALLGLMCVVLVVVVPLTIRRKRLVTIRETASNVMAGHVADVIGNMDAVQAYAHEQYELKHHRQNVADYMKKSVRSWDYHTIKIDMFISPIYVLINVIGLMLAVTFGNHGATLATIFVTFNYFAFTTRVLWEFNRTYRNIENALSEAAQFTELLLVPTSLSIAQHPIRLRITHGDVHFKQVTFAYDESAAQPLFKDLELHIAPGEKLALVGHSGGGKTTITKLLLRFVDVDAGEILIDGQNIADGTLGDLRSGIAYVPQEPIMFHRTIRENIRYGRLDASDEAVEGAAKKANAHEFISKLPHGYETLVGERGVKLSGGQRQRIAIARAIVKGAPVLMLDEATSALDSESEKLIQTALWKLMEGRTAIVIAHRLSTIQKMDRIIVLDNGRIAEAGTHRALLAREGIYATLWAHQSGGFIEE